MNALQQTFLMIYDEGETKANCPHVQFPLLHVNYSFSMPTVSHSILGIVE